MLSLRSLLQDWSVYTGRQALRTGLDTPVIWQEGLTCSPAGLKRSAIGALLAHTDSTVP